MNAHADIQRSWGSQQTRLYRLARRDGKPREIAAQIADISFEEARLHDIDDEKSPPPPEAYKLLREPDAVRLSDDPGVQRFELSTPEPVRAGPGQSQENTIARPRKARDPDDNGGAIPTKDFETAIKLLMNDILPAQSKVGEHSQEMSSAYKLIKKQCHIQPAAAKLAFKLRDTEDAKRDDFWRSLMGLCDALKIGPPGPDLVDAMVAGTGPAPVVAKPRPKLVTVPPSDGNETDLVDAALGKSDEFEASEAELAKQEGRGAKPSIGTIASPPLH